MSLPLRAVTCCCENCGRSSRRVFNEDRGLGRCPKCGGAMKRSVPSTNEAKRIARAKRDLGEASR